MRTAQEFKDKAKETKPNSFLCHKCSMCNYPCCWLFSDDYEHVEYDHGCDCTRRYDIRPSSYNEIANYYNIQKNENHIKEMDSFWGFDYE